MIRITTSVHCDECGEILLGLVRNSSDSKTARGVARRQGWAFFLGKDYCPACKHDIHKEKRND